jgi:hypothetical protein
VNPRASERLTAADQDPTSADRFEAAPNINVADWEPDPNNTPDEGFEEEDEE